MIEHPFASALHIATILACAVTASQAKGQSAESYANLSRRDREAQKVLKLAVAEEPPPGRCQYGTDWGQYKINAGEKRRLHVGAKFASPATIEKFRTIIDPDQHIDKTVFCTNAELKTYTDERISKFEAGSEQSMRIDRTFFNYPIFEKSLNKAVVVVTRQYLDGQSRHLGKISRQVADIVIEARVYRKVGVRWRFLHSYVLGIS